MGPPLKESIVCGEQNKPWFSVALFDEPELQGSIFTLYSIHLRTWNFWTKFIVLFKNTFEQMAIGSLCFSARKYVKKAKLIAQVMLSKIIHKFLELQQGIVC